MILQIAKTDGTLQMIKNVVQVDLSFLGNLEGEVFEKNPDWNFISIIQINEDGQKTKSLIKLDNILQFIVVKQRGGNDDSRK